MRQLTLVLATVIGTGGGTTSTDGGTESAGRYTIGRVGQNRIYAPYRTVYLVISLPKIP